jgi:hypothetical protein
LFRGWLLWRLIGGLLGEMGNGTAWGLNRGGVGGRLENFGGSGGASWREMGFGALDWRRSDGSDRVWG